MRQFQLKPCQTSYKNKGQAKQQAVIFHFTGKLEKADNRKHQTETDFFNLEIKSEKASLGIEKTIDEYIGKCKAEFFLYVCNDCKTTFLMTRKEFKSFFRQFGTKDRDSKKNGGKEKLRLKKESKKMRAWLKDHAFYF